MFILYEKLLENFSTQLQNISTMIVLKVFDI